MFILIIKDLVFKYGSTSLKVIAGLIIASFLAYGAYGIYDKYSGPSKEELKTQVKAQEEVINNVIAIAKEENKNHQIQNTVNEESKKDLITHFEKTAEVNIKFDDLKTKVITKYKPRPTKVSVLPTLNDKETISIESDPFAVQEIARTQENVKLLQGTVWQAYDLAVASST